VFEFIGKYFWAICIGVSVFNFCFFSKRPAEPTPELPDFNVIIERT